MSINKIYKASFFFIFIHTALVDKSTKKIKYSISIYSTGERNDMINRKIYPKKRKIVVIYQTQVADFFLLGYM